MELIDNMTIKEHIELSIAMCEKNECQTKGGMATRNMHKSTYRLIDVIEKLQAKLKHYETQELTYSESNCAKLKEENEKLKKELSEWEGAYVYPDKGEVVAEYYTKIDYIGSFLTKAFKVPKHTDLKDETRYKIIVTEAKEQ